jgi:hypothetical protein
MGGEANLSAAGLRVFKSPQGCSGTHPVGKDETRTPSAAHAMCAKQKVHYNACFGGNLVKSAL